MICMEAIGFDKGHPEGVLGEKRKFGEMETQRKERKKKFRGRQNITRVVHGIRLNKAQDKDKM